MKREVIIAKGRTITRTTNCYPEWCSEYVGGNITIPKGTPIKVVATLDAEPKRRVKMPDGAVWKRNSMHQSRKQWDLHTENLSCCAEVWACRSGGWRWRIDPGGTVKRAVSSCEEAQQVAMEALADAGQIGFRWEEVGPKCAYYRLMRKWPNEGLTGDILESKFSRYEYAVNECRKHIATHGTPGKVFGVLADFSQREVFPVDREGEA